MEAETTEKPKPVTNWISDGEGMSDLYANDKCIAEVWPHPSSGLWNWRTDNDAGESPTEIAAKRAARKAAGF